MCTGASICGINKNNEQEEGRTVARYIDETGQSPASTCCEPKRKGERSENNHMKYQKIRKTICYQKVNGEMQKPKLQKEPITYDKVIPSTMWWRLHN